VDPLEQILARDAAWHPALPDVPGWVEDAARTDGPPALLHEARWWEAYAAARRADWDRVTALAEAGLGEPFSEREAIRLALLHAVSGNVREAQHVLSQAVQWTGGEGLLGRFADLCEAEGLTEAAGRFRALSGPSSRPPTAAPR
jgi:hypothetical protein